MTPKDKINLLLNNLLNNKDIVSTEEELNTMLFNNKENLFSYCELLQENNKLAFMFLTRIKYRDYESCSILLKYFVNLVKLNTKKTNLFYVHQFLAVFSLSCKNSKLLTSMIKLYIDNNRFDLVNACSKKYKKVNLHKDNNIAEVQFIVENIKDKFIEFLSDSNNSNKEHKVEMLDIFYSLSYSDIHYFFEDNIESIFMVLFNSDMDTGIYTNMNDNRLVILIFDIIVLFTEKYNELLNDSVKTNILLFLIQQSNKGNLSNLSISGNMEHIRLIRKIVNTNTHLLSSNNLSFELQQYVLAFLSNYSKSNSTLTEEETTAILNKCDERSEINELICLLFSDISIDNFNNINSSCYFYICSVVKQEDKNIQIFIEEFIRNSNEINSITVTDIVLCLLIKKIVIESAILKILVEKYFTRDIFIFCHYFSECIKRNGCNESVSLSDLLLNSNDSTYLTSILKFNFKQYDIYTSRLIFMTVLFLADFNTKEKLSIKPTKPLIKIFEHTKNIIQCKIWNNQNSAISDKYIFHAYLKILTVGDYFDGNYFRSEENNNFSVKIVNQITRNEITETYHLLIMLLCVVIMKNKKQLNQTVASVTKTILGTDVFYKKYNTEMMCLVYECFLNNLIEIEELLKKNILSHFISSKYVLIFLYKVLGVVENKKVREYILNNYVDRRLVESNVELSFLFATFTDQYLKEEESEIFLYRLEELSKIYLHEKYARLVIKKMEQIFLKYENSSYKSSHKEKYEKMKMLIGEIVEKNQKVLNTYPEDILFNILYGDI